MKTKMGKKKKILIALGIAVAIYIGNFLFMMFYTPEITFGEPEDIYQIDSGIYYTYSVTRGNSQWTAIVYVRNNDGNINFAARKKLYEGNNGSKIYDLEIDKEEIGAEKSADGDSLEVSKKALRFGFDNLYKAKKIWVKKFEIIGSLF